MWHGLKTSTLLSTIAALKSEYLERRRDDPPSDPSVSDWISQNESQGGESSGPGVVSQVGDLDGKSLSSGELDATVIEYMCSTPNGVTTSHSDVNLVEVSHNSAYGASGGLALGQHFRSEND